MKKVNYTGFVSISDAIKKSNFARIFFEGKEKIYK